MRFSMISLIAAFALARVAGQPTIAGHQDALSFAYMYGYPLYSFGSLIRPLPEELPANQLLHNPLPATPGVIPVVRPNADTLYSVVVFDLSSQDVIITVPEITDNRFWVFPIYTPYGDDLVNIGSLGAVSAPGRYLLKYDSTGYGLDTENIPAGFAGVIKYPMAYGLSSPRILTNRTKEDLAIVGEIQNGFSIDTQERPGPPIAPALDLSIFRLQEYLPGANQTFGEAVLKVAAKIANYNPPYIVKDRKSVRAKLSKAGFKGDTFIQPKGTDIDAAIISANATVEAFASRSGIMHDVGNNWEIHDSKYIGLYNSNYEMRYSIASSLYLGLTAEQSVYPFLKEEVSAQEGKATLFTFTAVPKIKDNGFWSLTVYGPDQDLVDNDLKRYSLGDRDNLTFPDGSLVADGEGSFQILLQATDIEPPSNWTSNWLPIPAGGANVSATLRWYGAESEMSDGSYIHPEVTTIDALRA